MTPYEIQIALHYHTRVYDCWKPHGDIEHSALLGETLKWFQENGLLVFHENESKGQNYSPTDKLHAFCSMLQEVPQPVERFTDPRDRRVLSFEPVPGPVTGTAPVRRCHFCKIELRDDWVDPDWAPGPICRSCEVMHEPKQDLLCCCSIHGIGPCQQKAVVPVGNPIFCEDHYNLFGNPSNPGLALSHPICSSCKTPWAWDEFCGVGAKSWKPQCQCAGGVQSQPDPKHEKVSAGESRFYKCAKCGVPYQRILDGKTSGWCPDCSCSPMMQVTNEPIRRKEDVICPDCGKVIIGKDGIMYGASQLCSCGSKFS